MQPASSHGRLVYLSSVYCRVGTASETCGTTGRWATLACPAECLKVLTYKELKNDENYLRQLLFVRFMVCF